ncbi:maleylpyruvate isomerase family mycothiol-dependent enzyme [Nocardioides sp.]|uniref:maleylpyruvate isomerase family mycothiol-dependent enzyme n=1 Tax=Nocardioides sp. TaxID=35761 RepID=UPI00378398E5
MEDPTDLAAATRRLIRTADGLADADYGAPTECTGWTRAHVLAHLALNAEGLAGALRGIVEGRPTPMYASQERRDADIASLAAKHPSAIRSRLLGAATDLHDAVAAVPQDRAGTVVERVPGGATFTADDVTWMRLREVEIHHADLHCGYDRTEWPAEFALRLVASMLDRPEPALTLRAVDLDRTWSTGEGGPTVSGTAADLGWWLSGRGDGSDLTSDSGALPRIGA